MAFKFFTVSTWTLILFFLTYLGNRGSFSMIIYLCALWWVLIVLDATMAWYRERFIKKICAGTDTYALVTGASEGIGMEIARALAEKKWNLILVARNVAKLTKLATDFKKEFKVEVEIIPQDLSIPGCSKELYNKVISLRPKSNIEIDILVNNAGFGVHSKFAGNKLTTVTSMMQLNISTLTELTHLFGKHMIERRRGRIMNVGSVAGFFPCPTVAAYSASKAYVNTFTRALAYEMNPYGVGVVNLCPGATLTQFGKRSGSEQSLVFKLPGFVQTSRAVAKTAVKHTLAAGANCVCVPGLLNKIFHLTNPVLPLSFVMHLGNMLFE